MFSIFYYCFSIESKFIYVLNSKFGTDLFAFSMSTRTVLSMHVTKTTGYRIRNITVLNL